MNTALSKDALALLLESAVTHRNIGVAREALEMGADPNALVEGTAASLLTKACRTIGEAGKCSIEMPALLLKHGADPNNVLGMARQEASILDHPLFSLLRVGSSMAEQAKLVARMLFEHGADASHQPEKSGLVQFVIGDKPKPDYSTARDLILLFQIMNEKKGELAKMFDRVDKDGHPFSYRVARVFAAAQKDWSYFRNGEPCRVVFERIASEMVLSGADLGKKSPSGFSAMSVLKSYPEMVKLAVASKGMQEFQEQEPTRRKARSI